jgi:hypothetical protein
MRTHKRQTQICACGKRTDELLRNPDADFFARFICLSTLIDEKPSNKKNKEE